MKIKFLPFIILATGFAGTLLGCGTSQADKERADSLIAAADLLEHQGFSELGSGSEIEKYYIEALGNCREAEALGAHTAQMQTHLENNLLTIRKVVESQIQLSQGMPMAVEVLNRRIARIDSALNAK